MKFLSLSVLLCVLTCGLAQAQEATVTPPSAPPPKPGWFSLGAGVGFSGMGEVGVYPTAASLSGLSGRYLSRAPIGTALLEVRASDRVRVVAACSGSYDRRLTGDENTLGGGPKSSWSVGGSGGLRYVLNPGGVVEISPLLMLGAFKAESKEMRVSQTGAGTSATRPVNQDALVKGYDVRLGLVLEHALLANLWLRFETYFFRASYVKSATLDYTDNYESPCNCRRDLTLAWGLAPSLQLRLSF